MHPGTSTYCFGSVTSVIPPGLRVAAGPPLFLDTESESPRPSWNSLVLFWFVHFPGKPGTLFAGKSWLPKTRVFARKQNAQLSCSRLRFSGGVGVGEELFQSRMKDLA